MKGSSPFWAGSLAAKSKDGRWLSVLSHGRDTAEILIYLKRRWLPDWASRQFGEGLDRLLYFLGLVHDTGKLTAHFQARIMPSIDRYKEHLEGLGFPAKEPGSYPGHASAGEAILVAYGCPEAVAAIVGAHHGQPSPLSFEARYAIEDRGRDYYGTRREKWEEVWKEWTDYALHTSGFSSMEELPVPDIPRQVILTGLLIMGDWLSSNTDLFPIDGTREGRTGRAWEKMDFPDRWRPSANIGQKEVFREVFGFCPNVYQKALIDVAGKVTAPGLIMLEAPMGCGKTEAALAAAQILSARFGLGGIFFGLPSRATASGLFPRVRDWAKGQPGSGRHAISLRHGAAALDREYTSLFNGGGDDSVYVCDWFQRAKTGLLADFVTGTADQLLMAGIRRKHVMLRLLGLAGKTVIVDECHSYDAYMGAILDRLLSWLGICHVPVILLSATLPPNRKRALLSAYLGKETEAVPGYPMVTWTDKERVFQEKVETGKEEKRVRIERMEEDGLEGRLRSLDGCIGVIVNTVAKAQETAKRLRKAFPDRKVILCHSRFTAADRKEKEDLVLLAAGRKSGAGRNGTVIVGTQVLEQSLDIDFDYLFTQPCPMDSLLQRLGRLHRHDRKRPPGMDGPTCCLLLSDGGYDKGSAAVYGEWLLRRTLCLIGKEVAIPDQLSGLMENAFKVPPETEADKEDLDCLREYLIRIHDSRARAVGRCIKKPVTSRRYGNSLNGWLDPPVLSDCVRDTDEAVEVVLLMEGEEGPRFLPWAFDGKPFAGASVADAMSQKLRLPSGMNKYGEQIKKELSENSFWQDEDQLFLILDKGLETELCGYRFRYDRELGLVSLSRKNQG